MQVQPLRGAISAPSLRRAQPGLGQEGHGGDQSDLGLECFPSWDGGEKIQGRGHRAVTGPSLALEQSGGTAPPGSPTPRAVCSPPSHLPRRVSVVFPRDASIQCPGPGGDLCRKQLESSRKQLPGFCHLPPCTLRHRKNLLRSPEGA